MLLMTVILLLRRRCSAQFLIKLCDYEELVNNQSVVQSNAAIESSTISSHASYAQLQGLLNL